MTYIDDPAIVLFNDFNQRTFGQRHRKVTPRQWEEIRQRYLDGETAQELALAFGVSAKTIYGRMTR